MKPQYLFRVLWLVILLFAGAQLALAQTAQVTGRIADPTGGLIQGAAVTMTHIGKGVDRETYSNEEGYYTVPALEPGAYRMTVQMAGFKPVTRSGITLRVEQVARIDFTMEVGEVHDQVTVTGDSPLLESTTSSVGQVVDNRKIVDLPLNQRNPFSLVLLVPGVTGGVGTTFSSGRFSINGGRMSSNEILLDGIPSAPPHDGANSFTVFPSVDAVQEFRVQTSNYSSEFGLSGGGIINLIYKSGTNELHGSLYEFLRNSVFDANDFFANRNGLPLTSFKRNQFGGSVGGPVVLPKKLFGPFGYDGHNKTFFFFSYEGLRQRAAANLITTVPTEAMRRGDFSQLKNATGQRIVIYDPVTTAGSGQNVVRQAFPGNIIPADRFDAVARNTTRYWPLPNRPGDANTGFNNFVTSGSTPFDIDQWDVKMDQNLSDRQRLAVRVSRRELVSGFPTFFPAEIRVAEDGRAFPETAHNVGFDYTLTASPTHVVNVRYGFARNLWRQSTRSDGFDPTELGFPAYYRNNLDNLNFPAIAPAGYYRLGHGYALGIGRTGLEVHTWQLGNTKVLSRHLLKFGAEMRMMRNNVSQYGNTGNFNFGRNFTVGPNPVTNANSPTAGDGFASFLLGLGGGSFTKNFKIVSTQSFYYGVYLNDDWKVTSRLTFNLGLRYELNDPRTERYDRTNYIDPFVTHPLGEQLKNRPGFSECPACANLKGGLVYVGASGTGRKQFETDRNNFSPRFGFAYQATKETVVRGAYGIFYSVPVSSAAGTIGLNGFRSDNSLLGTLDGVTPNHYLSNPYPNGFAPLTGSSLGLMTFVGLGPSGPLRDSVTPYTQNWNFGIQRELPGSLLIDASYVGSRGVHLSDNFLVLNQLEPKHLALGAKLLEQVPNPFFGLIPASVGALGRPTIQRRNLLLPYPQFSSLTPQYSTGSSSIYHSFQLKAEKRLSNGLSFLLAYTNAKLIDDSSQSNGNYGRDGVRQNTYDRRADRSISPNDISQRLVIGFVYELPFGRGRLLGKDWNRVADVLAGGWQVNGIATLQTGVPLTISAPNTCNCFSNGQRPNINGSAKGSGDVYAAVNNTAPYFNTSVFSAAPLYTFGNAPRTLPDVRGPGTHNWDFSVFKNFRILEGLNVQFRAEAFNLLNRVQFQLPEQNFGNLGRGFGQITSQANSPRQMQFALKVLF
ncbi:MAG: TonB-dependent receptor domain-containing protein [Acidobacteriota bacterium]